MQFSLTSEQLQLRDAVRKYCSDHYAFEARQAVASDAERLRHAGIHAAYAISDIESDPQRWFDEAAPLLEQIGERLARDRLLTEAAETGART